MDLLEKIRSVFEIGALKKKYTAPDVVYVDSTRDYGKVHTIDIRGFGERGNPDDYENVATDKGEEMFRTLLKRLYHEVLYRDPAWHYFMEGSYNHLRFSFNLWQEIRGILDLHETHYNDPKLWVDEQGATRKYQHIFKGLFHGFSQMAVEGYEEDEIDSLLDRVIHCFMNHQQLYLLEHRKEHGAMTEAILVARYVAKRAEYTGYCSGIKKAQKNYNKWAEEARTWYHDECEKKQVALEEYRTSSEEILEMVAELEPEEAKEALKYMKEKKAELNDEVSEEAEGD